MRGIVMALERRHRLHGRALGAAVGGVGGFGAGIVVHLLVAGDHSGLFAFPATISTAIFVGVGIGLMFASIVVGGREDDRATHAAREALRREHVRHASFRRQDSIDSERPAVHT
jgi:hypothetical protein